MERLGTDLAKLTQAERERLAELIREGKPLPVRYRSALFAEDDAEFVEVTKDYRLHYKGKMPKEAVLRTTPAAPLQHIRSFNSDNSFDDDWRNMLIFGDNLLALKALYNDQQGPDRFRTRNRIKLIYIDPPFATKQDFMKDREKAYRDKVIGAQFIEFLRRRLILMREILADDGSIYVHLDTKKGHYIKAILDEVFGEENFRNEIVWRRSTSHSDAQKYGQVHDLIYFYSKGQDYYWKTQYKGYTQSYIDRYFRFRDPDGRRFWKEDATGAGGGPPRRFGERLIDPPSGRHWRWTQGKIDELWSKNRFVLTASGKPEFKRYLDEQEGEPIGDLWDDIKRINMMADERMGYPTQKPEDLLERIIDASSPSGSIVLDAFCGSGTTPVVAEKLGRRWIGMDCGKFALYSAQQRLLHLITQIGTVSKDDSREHERVTDFDAHSKSASRGLLLVYEKARAGDLNITDGLLRDLAAFLQNHLAGDQKQEFSLMCPEDKFQVQKLPVTEEDLSAGEKAVDVGKIRFLISFIQPKAKPEKPNPLKAKEFALYHAGIYDKELILNLPWAQYRPFVLQLFGVREEPHRIRGLTADGYIGLHSAYLWPYPEHRDLVLDRGYVESLHEVMQGRGGDRFYMIAPGSVMAFMEDEIEIGQTTYVILKVPLSMMMALIERGEVGGLKQPTSAENVNEVIDAVGYDFISQPVVEAAYTREAPAEESLFNRASRDYVIRLTDFRSNTLATDPEDFKPFETLSMMMVDTDHDGKTFNLSRVFWADDIVNAERGEAVARLAEAEVTGETMMIIFMDKYGNELKVCKKASDFKAQRARRAVAKKKTAKKKAAKKK